MEEEELMHPFLTPVRKICLSLALFAVPLLTAAAVLPSAAAAAVAPVHAQAPATVMVSGVSRLHVRDFGRTAPNTRVNLTITLNYRNERDLAALVRDASDPASPAYGKFLTPQQFRDNFAPTLNEYVALARTLERAGFTVTQTSANRTLLNVSAPATTVERYFNTTIHNVTQDDKVLRYANARPAYMPVALRGFVFSIGGFDNLRIAKTLNVRAPAARTDLALGPPLQGPDTGLGPFALATAYDYPVQHAVPGAKNGRTYDGTGHAAGIAIDSDILDSDLTSFLAYFHVKRTAPAIVRTLVDGGPHGVTFDQVEATLDAETIAGLAPGAGIDLYLMPALTYVDIIDTYNKVVADDKVDVLNSSFGGCEIGTLPATFPQTSDHIAEQGAAEGITFSASSGDFGADTCIGITSNFVGVSTPASGSHFTAAGGTSLLINTSGAYRAELGWIGSGGGVSTLFALPAYQKGLANIITAGRNVPDIAFDANPGTGPSLYLNGAFVGPIGGTSVSSPLFSALVTELNQVHAKRAGQINIALYARYKAVHAGSVFRDVTLGTNAYFGPGYNALAGYDQVTGLGSIVGWPYAK